ncbi:MAG: hypothetical protein HY300_17690 [Verrucomicrobia bacterium]|nr:hypothetical protein [Verrucomicrobiota bacterium]
MKRKSAARKRPPRRLTLSPLARLRHDLRTRIMLVMGYAEITQEEAAESGMTTIVGELQTIVAASEQLAALIDERLADSPAALGAGNFSRTQTELLAPVRRILEISGPLLKKTARDSGLLPDVRRMHAAALGLSAALEQPFNTSPGRRTNRKRRRS